ncbi:MAG: hypothetical protein O7C60_03560 [Rickettsia endosymbiont of Ixodes persulcatus]|nr:hypothetical protein [Rickettsia endosymbiont of Ixodes persulcatus]
MNAAISTFTDVRPIKKGLTFTFIELTQKYVGEVVKKPVTGNKNDVTIGITRFTGVTVCKILVTDD